MKDKVTPKLGDLVKYSTKYPQCTTQYGLILKSYKKDEMSDILWDDGITTCEWEDLEVVSESSIV